MQILVDPSNEMQFSHNVHELLVRVTAQINPEWLG
jgi:hypothetical protein